MLSHTVPCATPPYHPIHHHISLSQYTAVTCTISICSVAVGRAMRICILYDIHVVRVCVTRDYTKQAKWKKELVVVVVIKWINNAKIHVYLLKHEHCKSSNRLQNAFHSFSLSAALWLSDKMVHGHVSGGWCACASFKQTKRLNWKHLGCNFLEKLNQTDHVSTWIEWSIRINFTTIFF